MTLEALVHDPLTRLIAQIVTIVIVARLIGLVARPLGQPMVIAEIAAGIVLGPSLLGWLAPEVSAVLFAPESLGNLQLVAQLGLVLFMFLIGLELDPALLRGRASSSFAISHTSIVVPFALGAVLALYLYPRLSSEAVSFAAFALFLGAAMSITAFPVLARILSERGLLRSRVGAVTLASAAVDDVTAWCLLAFVVATARASGLQSALVTTALTAVYIAFMAFALRPLLARLGTRVSRREGLTQNLVALVMVLLFASSWATELIGIHALFGAFLLGAIMPREGRLAHALAEKLEDLVLVVLLPLFFAYSGVRTQIGLLDSLEAWLICALIIVVACLGKFGGSAVAARLTGMSWRESSAIGVLMNTRGLMELIVLNVGLDLGVISPTLFAMMVVMALFTTFITTPALALILPREAPLAVAGESAPAKRFAVLVAVELARSAPHLVALGAALRGDRRNGPLDALQLELPTDRRSFYLARAARERTSAVSSSGPHPVIDAESARALDVRVNTVVSVAPAQDICNVAEASGAELVLLGWHLPVLGQSHLGGTVDQVLRKARHATVAVLVDHGLGTLRHVLVPFAGAPHDPDALALAERLLESGASLTLLAIGAAAEADTAEQAMLQRSMSTSLREAIADGRASLVQDAGGGQSPVERVLEAARREPIDLVVIGLGRTWGLERRRLGALPEPLIEASPVSLLIVRGADPAAAAHDA